MDSLMDEQVLYRNPINITNVNVQLKSNPPELLNGFHAQDSEFEVPNSV